MNRYTVVIWAVALLVLGWVNASIVGKEQLIASGQPVLLQLAPVDPRSLIQGDYMVLRYAITDEVNDRDLPARGALVVQVDQRGVASFVCIYDGQQPLATNERLLRFHHDDGSIYIGAESFFFQEGYADVYSNAEYAELRVSDNGESVLVGLRGPDLVQLEPPSE